MVSLTDQHVSHLKKEFTKEEVEAATKSLTSLTSLGPDRIPPVFIQKDWSTYGNEITKAIIN